MLLVGLGGGISIYHYNYESISRHYTDTTELIMTQLGFTVDKKENTLQRCLRLVKKVKN